MTTRLRPPLLLTALLATGCGGMIEQSSSQGFGCAPVAAKYQPSPTGISGSWLVALAPAAPLHTTAAWLAARYDGAIVTEWESLGMVHLQLDDARAEALSRELVVCFVAQDAVLHGGL